jgi:hypothetical protein
MIDFGLVITFHPVVGKTRWGFRQLDDVHAFKFQNYVPYNWMASTLEIDLFPCHKKSQRTINKFIFK